MTARQIIEARLGRKLPPAAELPRDLRRAILLLGLQLERQRRELEPPKPPAFRCPELRRIFTTQ